MEKREPIINLGFELQLKRCKKILQRCKPFEINNIYQGIEPITH